MALTSNFGINISQEFQSGVLGVSGWNNVFPTAQYQGDLNYLYDTLGVRYVRVAGQATSGDPTIIAIQDNCAALAKAKGFNVAYGLTPPSSIKPGDWISVFAAQQTHALSIQAAASTDTYYIANEMESDNYFSGRTEQVTSVSRTSNVVTVVMPRPLLIQTGDHINWFTSASSSSGSAVIGISPNTNFTVTVVNSTTFTFSSSGSDASQSGGVWIQLASKAIIGMIKRQATALKAAGITMLLSNSCLQGNRSAALNSFWITNWTESGRGDIDYCDLNIYGTSGFPVTNTLEGYLKDFKNQVIQGYNTFGSSNFRVTEWSANSQTTSLKPTNSATLVKYQIERLKFLQSMPNLIHYLFAYRERAESDAFDALKPYNQVQGTVYRDWWWPMIAKRPLTTEIQFGTPVAIQGVRKSPITTTSSTLQFNYGSQVQGGVAFYNATTVANDLNFLWNAGVRKLRIALSDYTFADGVNATLQVASDAKRRGFYTIWGVTHPGFATPTDANWSTLTAAVNVAADRALAAGLDEFQVGNEIEYAQTVTGGLTNAVGKIQAMATDVKTNHFTTGVVSYAMAQDSLESTWISGGKGDLDLLGYNVYGSFGDTNDFKSKVSTMFNAFGSGMYISEWNLNNVFASFEQPESAQTADIADRLEFLQSLGILNFFFTYTWPTSSDQFALLKADGTYRGWYSAFFTPAARPNAGSRQAAGARTTI